MDEEASNGAEAIELSGDENEGPEKPLLGLFKRLIGNNNKQNTVLTNAQITDILQEEFHLQVSSLHELEVDIFMNVIKKFLKDWPQWDEFDKLINVLKTDNDTEGMQKLLMTNYNGLKEYLRVMLNIAEPIAKDTIEQFDALNNTKKLPAQELDVLMEISCSRSQLNQLFIRVPTKDNVFNIEETAPSRIRLAAPSFEAMMNWWCFIIHINLKTFFFKRETVHELKHVLVNKKLGDKTEVTSLNRCHQEKTTNKAKQVTKQDILFVIDGLISSFKGKGKAYINIIDTICTTIKKDISDGPNTMKVPGMYRRYMSKYPYVRYLYADTPGETPKEDAKYDLQLEETISPMFKYNIRADTYSLVPVQQLTEYYERIYIECTECNVKMQGVDLLTDLEQHFMDWHQNEPDWQCVFCHKVFTMKFLANARWRHKC